MKFNFPLDIVIIDDETDISEMIRMALTFIDEFNPVCFSSSIEGFEFIKNNRIRFLMTDLIMPDLSGDELIKRCRSLPWNIDVLVLTGSEHPEMIYQCYNLGVLGIFTKPVEIYQLIELLKGQAERYRCWHEVSEELGIK